VTIMHDPKIVERRACFELVWTFMWVTPEKILQLASR